ncbi:MAG TPA: hypothetical protein DCP91_00485 [Eggerthellaceae bacterium]|nr:hypothetical protein [Eggerthellaceae bacterium]
MPVAALALLAFALAAALCPSAAFARSDASAAAGVSLKAAGSLAQQAVPDQEVRNGWVYVSVSHDGKYAVSDGEIPGQTMWRVPIDLADVGAEVDLEELGLEQFRYDADADGVYDTTLLQVMLYLNAHYAADPTLQVTGGPHSAFIHGLFGYDFNLNYYVNGQFPMDESLGSNTGASADAIVVSDGDFIDIAHYSDPNFYHDELSGYRYFYGASGQIVHSYVAAPGTDFTAKVGRVAADLDAASTFTVAEPGCTVYRTDKVDAVLPVQIGTTQADGTIQARFDEPGVYYLYVNGSQGKSTTALVSTPAFVRVYVTDASGVQQLIDALARARRDLGTTVLSSAGADGVAPSKSWVDAATAVTFKSAIAQAQATLDGPPAADADVASALGSLAAAQDVFDAAKQGGAAPDSDAYRAAVEAAGAEVLATRSSADGRDVPPSVSWSSPQARSDAMAAVYAANALLDQSSGQLASTVSVREADAALARLEDALVAFRAALKPGVVPDVTVLSRVVSEAAAAKAGIQVSAKSGSDVPKTAKWTTSAAFSALDSALSAAAKVQDKVAAGTATTIEVDDQAVAVAQARDAFLKTVKAGTKADAKPGEQAGDQPATPLKLSKPVLTAKTKSAKKNKVTIAWKKVANAGGYQLKVGAKTYTVKKATTLKKTVTVKKKAKVKVRVRAFKKVGKKTVYGPWSTTKTVRVKR